MTIKVAIDNQIFSSQVYGGISRYFSSLGLKLSRMEGVGPQIVAPMHYSAYLDDLPRGLVIGGRVKRTSRTSLINRVASSVMASFTMRRLKPDLVHKTYYYPLPIMPRNTPTVITVFDMIHEKFPQSFRKNDPVAVWKKSAVAKSDHIICISENTKRDLLDLYSLPEEKVSVTYLGYDTLSQAVPSQHEIDQLDHVLDSSCSYILYVGSRVGYKNFSGLLRAYSLSKFLRENYLILCFGGGHFDEYESRLISKYGLSGRVRHIGGTDAVLADCYRNASLFVYPSLYEGFGIPPLEAMSLGCPVACSNTSSIPEVVGDAAAMFDPSEPESICSTMEYVLSAATVSEELVRRGRQRKSLFSWQKCALETVETYKKVIQK
ncbi:MAG: glycosyltransferase family 1 protein [Candidatus Sedimenticola sp. 20ELBAFRAG]